MMMVKSRLGFRYGHGTERCKFGICVFDDLRSGQGRLECDDMHDI